MTPWWREWIDLLAPPLCAGNGVSAGPGYTAFKAIADDYDLPKVWKRDDRIY